MKKFFWLLILSCISVTAQNTIQGKVVDANTSEPIPYVNVFSMEIKQGVYTNEDGEFRFEIPSTLKEVTISCLGYTTLVASVDAFQVKGNVISLVPDEYLLDEVVLTNKPLHEIVSNLIDNSKRRLNDNVKLETYFREFLIINNQYSKFCDGLVDYYIKPKRKDKVKPYVIVNQSRAFELTAADKIETNGKMDMSAVNTLTNFKTKADDFFNLDIIENYLSKAKDSKKYDFEIRSQVSQDGKALEKIIIKPLPEVKEQLIEGVIVYDATDKVIIDVDLKTATSHSQYAELRNMLLFKFKIYDLQIKMSFLKEGNTYIPNYKKEIFDFYIKFGKQIDDRFKGINDLLVNNYYDTNISIPDQEKLYQKSSLYENGMNYTSKYWNSNRAILLSEKEERILETLQNK